MRRMPLLTPLLPAAATGFVLGSAPLRIGAPASAGQGFVGAWRVIFETPLGPSQSLLMADGTVLFSVRPVSPVAGSAPIIFGSAGHGVWRQTGPTIAATTRVGFVTDAQGTVLAIVTDSVEATLGAEGNDWSGEYRASVADADGTILYGGGVTVRATPIAVHPLAMPAGTPTAWPRDSIESKTRRSPTSPRRETVRTVV